jgi:mRNA interferase ChpB
VNKIRMMDLAARKACRIERAPKEIVEEALARLQTVLDAS